MAELLPFVLDDVKYPSDNDYEIPMLLLDLAAPSVIGHFRLWGSHSQLRPKPDDTYGFYTRDQKFTALIKHPENLVRSRCKAIVEPNFSTNDRTPFATGLYGIYLKRKIARYVQDEGVKVLVDLTVHPKFADLNLLGVPAGWPSYAIRPNKTFGDTLWLDANYELARQHSGLDRPYFFVYGGGRLIKKKIQTEHWDSCDEYMETVKHEQR